MKNFESLTVSDYIDIARRRVWYAVVTTIVITAAAAVHARGLPSIYKSETTIAISNRFLPENYLPTIDRSTSNDRMDFVRQQLQSRTFLEAIVQEFRLAGPDGMDRASEVIRSKIEITVLSPNTFKLGFPANDPESAQAVTKRLAERIIQSNDSSRLEKVQVADQFLEEQLQQAGDELTAAEQKLLQFRNEAFPGITTDVVTPDTLRDLQAQLAKSDLQLEAAADQRKALQRRLEEHRQLKMALSAPPPPAPAQAATAAPAAAVQAPAAAPSPLEVELSSRRTQLAAASIRYTPLHPEVVRLTQEVRELEALVQQQQAQAARAAAQAAAQAAAAAEKAPRPEEKPRPFLPEFDLSLESVPAEIQLQLEQLDRDVLRIKQTRDPLAARVASYQNRLNPTPAVAEELAKSTRDYDAAKQRYNLLSEKRSNSKMAARADSSENNEMFRVIDPAFLPRKPIGPNRRLIATLGSVAGLVLGFGIAFLREFMDSSVQTPDDLANAIKLPVLATIPSISDKTIERQHRKVKSTGLSVIPLQKTSSESAFFSLLRVDGKVRNAIVNPLCSAREHYRFLHSQLLTMQRSRPLKTILISSANPGEGKTFSACSLAGILAQESGKKVLLIDADLRRPSATTTLGIRQQDVPYNIVTVLRGRSSVEESVVRCEDLNLYFLPAGPATANPGELLSSARLEPVLRQCTDLFDWIIIDTPPILAAADVNMMTRFCDAILMVVQSGKTPLKMIKDSIKRVGHDHICGVIMNRVRAAQSSSYYGDYYVPDLKDSSATSILQSRD